MPIVFTSHLVNVIVVTIIPYLIFTDAPSMAAAFGEDTPARRILACIYATIALASVAALVLAAGGRWTAFLSLSASLFAIQIIYKMATWPAVGLGHPVVNANLVICVIHGISLFVVFRTQTSNLG